MFVCLSAHHENWVEKQTYLVTSGLSVQELTFLVYVCVCVCVYVCVNVCVFSCVCVNVCYMLLRLN